MKRADLWIVAVVVGLSAWAVWAQVDTDPVGVVQARQGPAKLEVGAPLEDQDVRNPAGASFRLHSTLGRKATVFYAWSTDCPCVDLINERMLGVTERFKPLGVAFVAVAGSATDSAEAVAQRLLASWTGKRKDGTPMSPNGLPPYGMIHDPTQRLCKQLGFQEAAQFAVVDANGVLCYRGTFDDDLKKPTTTWLADALEDVVAGRSVGVPLRPVPGYGCPFGIPPADCPVDAPAGSP